MAKVSSIDAAPDFPPTRSCRDAMILVDELAVRCRARGQGSNFNRGNDDRGGARLSTPAQGCVVPGGDRRHRDPERAAGFEMVGSAEGEMVLYAANPMNALDGHARGVALGLGTNMAP